MRPSIRASFVLISILGLALATACSDNPGDGGNNNGIDGGNNNGDGGNNNGDGGNNTGPDGGNVDPCSGAQCSNCIDDDGDGDIDGNDVHCISALDDDESSFETGISGDNMDSTWQDCFFDGNSGAGDDGCRYHSCCLYPPGECPDAGNFDPATDCEISQQCIDFCAPSAPPGCDCFGCCTICNDANECFNVITNPAVAPDCDVDATGTPVNCPECVPSECGSGGCEPTGCTLCPGQDPEDLPPECNEQNQCPNGGTACTDNTACGAGEFCLNMCCTPQIG